MNPQQDDSSQHIDEAGEAALEIYFLQKKDGLFKETFKFCEEYIGKQHSPQQADT